MNRIIISGILSFAALIFTSISITPYEGGILIGISLLVILIGGISIGYFISAWSKGSIKKNFKSALKISFGISSLIYLVGYLFTSLQGLV